MNISDWNKTYIAIDLKTFYASVECVERALDPLKTNLVVADESRTEKTICLAVTQSLKAYGLSGRSRLFEVVQKAKEVEAKTGKKLEYLIAPPRMALYIQYSARIYEIYLKYFAPEDIHVYSIDEVFIDATNYLSYYRMDAKLLCQTVIKDILKCTGITATAGIAPNLFLCKAAMDIVAKHIAADENGVRIAVLDVMDYRHLLWNHRPLTDFWRIGPGIVKRLENNCMYTMGDIARRSLEFEDSLYKIFGIDAEILIDHAWGYEPCEMKHIKSYRSDEKSIGSGQVLHCPYDSEKTRLIVKEMTEVLVMNLVKKHFVASSFTLVLGYDSSCVTPEYNGPIDIDRYGKKIPKSDHGTANFGESTSSTKKIMETVLQTYDKIINPKLLVRRVNISANNVLPVTEEQYSLFDDVERSEKERKLQQTVLDLQKKFGKNSVLKGMNLEEGGTMKERNAQIGGHHA